MLDIKENGQMVSVQFDSITDLMEVNSDLFPHENSISIGKIINGTDERRNWYGSYLNSKQVLNSALLGDKVLYEKHLKSKVAVLKEGECSSSEQSIKSIKRKTVYGSMGDELDIHKIYQGRADTAWRKTKRVEVAQKFHLVTILIDYGGCSSERVSDSLWRSAVAIKIYEELLKAGKSVRIVSGSLVGEGMIGTKKLLSTTIGIKRYNEQLSVERLAAMTNISFYRSAGFIAMYSQKRNTTDYLGRPMQLTENLSLQLQEEENMGHTKFVRIGRVSSRREAMHSVEQCYQQMEEFTK